MMNRGTVRNVEFHSKNKFEKLVHLVGFIIGIYHDARSHERQIGQSVVCVAVLPRTNRASESFVLCSGHVVIGPIDHLCFFLTVY
jgi:hypothetical protein